MTTIFFILFLILLFFISFFISSAITKKGKIGINLSLVKCPKCGVQFSAVRVPKNMRQLLWGGGTCQNCGCETDKWGNEIKKK